VFLPGYFDVSVNSIGQQWDPQEHNN